MRSLRHSMGASYAAREGSIVTAEAPEGQQQQQEQQEQPPASQQMLQVCSEYGVHISRAANTESAGVILEAEIQRVLGVYEQYY